MIRKFLLGIDLFGISVPINFSGKEKANSKLGGSCSLIFLCFIGWAVYNASEALIKKNDPTISMFHTYQEDPEEIILSSNTFPIGIQIQAPRSLLYKSFINESIYQLKIVHNLLERITHENGTVEEKWTFTEISTERCTPEHFGALASNFISLDLTSIYCIKQPEFNQISIQGVFESQLYRGLTISIMECDNSTSSITCASRNILDTYLEGARFSLLYANLAVNLQDYSTPTFRFKDSYKATLSPGTIKVTTIELSKVKVATNSGWVIQPDDTSNFIKVEKVSEGLQLGINSQKVLMTCNLEASKIQNDYSRSYKKIQNILAEVGGLANALIVIFSIVIKPYLKFKVEESLMNELFEVSTVPKIQRMRSRSFTFRSKNLEKSMNQPAPSDQIENVESESLEQKSESSAVVNNESKLSQFIRKLSASSAFLNRPKIRKFLARNEQKSYASLSLTSQMQSSNTFENFNKSNNFISGIKKGSPNAFHFESSSIDFFEKQETVNCNLPQEKSPTIPGPTLFDESSTTPSNFQNNIPNHRIIDISKKIQFNLKSLDHRNFSIDKSPKKVSIALSVPKSQSQSQSQSKESSDSSKKGSFSERLTSENIKSMKLNHLIRITKRSTTKKTTLSLWEYLCSFIYKTDKLKRKLKIIHKGIKNIHQRLDVVNIFKKLRELDKLKAITLDPNQLLLFNNLPRPEIFPKSHRTQERRASFSRESLRKLTFIPLPASEYQLLHSLEHLKARKFKTNIDDRLIEIFDEINY